MPRNGSGTYTVPPGTPGVALADITTTAYNGFLTDMSTAMSDSINKDGTKAFAGNQSMGGFKLTSLGLATTALDAVTLSQVQGNTFNWAAAGGTADALTAAMTPTVTAYTNGARFRVRALLANTTTTPTINIDSVGAKTIVKGAGSALIAGDIAGSGHELDLTYNSSLDKFLLGNPQGSVAQLTPTEIWEFACSDETTAITAGTSKFVTRARKALTVSAVRASLTTAGSGASQFDINLAGITMLSTKLTIDSGEKTSVDAATQPVISDTTIADDQEITIDFDSVGSGATGVKIAIIGTPS